MPRPKRWTETKVENGIGSVTLYKWQYFLDYVYQEMLDYSSYVWRGQRCDNWPLESTLDRLVRRAKIPVAKQSEFRRGHLERFKYATRGRRGSSPPALDSDNDWWALGQHHGLATPLLDWTESPFVAAYFAFIDSGEPQTARRAVYALQRSTVEQKAMETWVRETTEQEAKVKELETTKPLAAVALGIRKIRPQVEFITPMSNENARLVNQAGLFSRAPDSTSINDWVRANFAGETAYILMRITVPDRDRKDCLRSLKRMNINHQTLFPDLVGASTFCNLHAEIERY